MNRTEHPLTPAIEAALANTSREVWLAGRVCVRHFGPDGPMSVRTPYWKARWGGWYVWDNRLWRELASHHKDDQFLLKDTGPLTADMVRRVRLA